MMMYIFHSYFNYGEFALIKDQTIGLKAKRAYQTLPIRDTLCFELSWSHYRVLLLAVQQQLVAKEDDSENRADGVEK